jgi:hypothetical protein
MHATDIHIAVGRKSAMMKGMLEENKVSFIFPCNISGRSLLTIRNGI